MPVTYGIHTVRLLTSIIKQPTFYEMGMRLFLTAQFSVYGLFYFPLSLLVDTLVFFFNLYTEATIDTLNTSKSKHFSREGLQLFEESLDEILVELETKKTKMMKNHENLNSIVSLNGGLLMDMTEVTIILQEKFDVIGEVSRLIFDNRAEGKFVYNPYTKKS